MCDNVVVDHPTGMINAVALRWLVCSPSVRPHGGTYATRAPRGCAEGEPPSEAPWLRSITLFLRIDPDAESRDRL